MPSIARSHINVKETMAVILAIYRWAPPWQGRHIIIYTDNITTCAAINKGISKDPLVMSYLCNVFWLGNIFNFTMSSTHIAGSLNIYADSASRLHNKGHFLHWISVILVMFPSQHALFGLTYVDICHITHGANCSYSTLTWCINTGPGCSCQPE